ncbi:hypothetical protein BRADI_5g08895v3, partial [Brachypodium distachyon]
MKTGEKPHVVCLPAPAQGHITPMLKLAKILHARGFHVTFVNTKLNQQKLLSSRGPAALDGLSDFRFAVIQDGLPPSGADPAQVCHSITTICPPNFLALLAELNDPANSEVPPVTCLIVDGVMSFCYDAAKEIGVPCAALWTSSACGFMGFHHYRLLLEQGLVPFKDVAQVTDNSYLDTVVHGFPGLCEGMRLRDFPSFIRTTDRNDIMLNFVMDFADRLLSLPDAVLLNTFDEIERPVLDAMRAILPPMYAIGPLHRRASIEVPAGSSLDGIGSNLWKEQHDGLLEWLGAHGTRTIVYVNYGSFTVMTKEQLLEFAWGLADSEYPFMWNIRPDLLKGDTAVLPPEFLSAVSGRSMLTTWCPQEKVIVHDAVGLFLTHSGWNSTLESVCAGVPMLSWPFFAEQQTNCRYKCTEWGIGLEIGGEVKRAELAAMIGEVMEGEKGREMRRRAAEWKDEAVRATLPGGPAEASLDT